MLFKESAIQCRHCPLNNGQADWQKRKKRGWHTINVSLFVSHTLTGRLSYYGVDLSTQGQPHRESFPLSILSVSDHCVKACIAAAMAIPAKYQEAALIGHRGTAINLRRKVFPCWPILFKKRWCYCKCQDIPYNFSKCHPQCCRWILCLTVLLPLLQHQWPDHLPR